MLVRERRAHLRTPSAFASKLPNLFSADILRSAFKKWTLQEGDRLAAAELRIGHLLRRCLPSRVKCSCFAAKHLQASTALGSFTRPRLGSSLRLSVHVKRNRCKSVRPARTLLGVKKPSRPGSRVSGLWKCIEANCLCRWPSAHLLHVSHGQPAFSWQASALVPSFTLRAEPQKQPGALASNFVT